MSSTRRTFLTSAALLVPTAEVLADLFASAHAACAVQDAQAAVVGARARSAPPQLTDEQRQILNYFLEHTTDSRVRAGSYNGYGISDLKLLEIMNQVSWRVIQPDLDHVPGREVAQLARLVKGAVGEVIAELDFKPNQVLWQRLMAQGVCDWVRTRVVFDVDLERAIYRNPSPDLLGRKDPRYVLGMQSPAAVCTGFSLLARNVAREISLTCFYVNGVTRSGAQFRAVKPKPHHVWNVFVLADGLNIPADLSRSPVALPTARRDVSAIRSTLSLPVFADEFAIFSAVCHAFNSASAVAQGDPQNRFFSSDLDMEQWRAVDARCLNGVLPVPGIFGR